MSAIALAQHFLQAEYWAISSWCHAQSSSHITLLMVLIILAEGGYLRWIMLADLHTTGQLAPVLVMKAG
jgi:hypothetical protein